MTDRPVFSVVVPVFNSERTLKELSERLISVFENKLKAGYEIIFVDDASNDRSWDVLQELDREHEKISIIQLSRNFGQHNATLCGFNACRGQYIITLDDDLQHLPEDIPGLYQRLLDTGADVVIGRPEIKRHSLFRKLGSLVIDRAYRSIFNKPAGLYIGSFRLMKAWVVGEIINDKSPNPMIGGMLLQSTSRIVNFTINHGQRRYGRSNYGIGKIFQLSFNLLINYSTIPLRTVSVCGLLLFGASLMAGLIVVLRKIFGLVSVPGWTSVMLLLLFFSGLNLIVLGVVGEYLARIIKEVTHTRQYVIRERTVSK